MEVSLGEEAEVLLETTGEDMMGNGTIQRSTADFAGSLRNQKLCTNPTHNTGQCGFFTNADRRSMRAELNAMSLDGDDVGEDEAWADEQDHQAESEAAQGSGQQDI